jgi:ribonucleoside-triphosphate reductase (formate)
VDIYNPSIRAQIITRRTYNRPLNNKGTKFETWEETIERVIQHQVWLWERAKCTKLTKEERHELERLRELMLVRKISMAGRTLWLGGTELSKVREASMFNCAFTYVKTIHDVVDCLWLLLQGCGVGFSPRIGTLTGFSSVIPKVEFIRSTRGPDEKGRPENIESWVDGVWTIGVGDSAEAWAKSIGKLLAGKKRVKKLVFDTSEVRGAGSRLSGYGWISSGDGPLVNAIDNISKIMNRRAGSLLSRIDMLDLMNWLGTILSTRRSAEICLFNIDEPEWDVFAVAKKDYFKENVQRGQSNNSLLFNRKPKRSELEHIFTLMQESGGSEPGFINAETSRLRAPWFYGVNPCAEILLGDKSFCNLTEIDLGKFIGDAAGLDEAILLTARANYRQTCVNLRDGVLQEAWHLNNEFLRLCGVGLTGIIKREDLGPYELMSMQRSATSAAYQMADELKLPRPKNVTTVKPSGTLSKIMDTTEGIHKPLGKYIINNVNFGKNDPLLPILRESGYRVFNNPNDPEGVLVSFPVIYEGIAFDTVGGVEVNLESAIDQLERYKKYQQYWTQQNTSVTISYSPGEVPDIISWLLDNWSFYVGVSFIYRNDPTKSAKDLGYLYLPQEVVTREYIEEYMKVLKPIDLEAANSFEEIRDEECASGVCPVR